MSRKFMIVLPRPCCGNTDAIGKVFSFNGYRNGSSICECGAKLADSRLITSPMRSVQESRIVWLPDDLEVILHDDHIEEEA